MTQSCTRRPVSPRREGPWTRSQNWILKDLSSTGWGDLFDTSDLCASGRHEDPVPLLSLRGVEQPMHMPLLHKATYSRYATVTTTSRMSRAQITFSYITLMHSYSTCRDDIGTISFLTLGLFHRPLEEAEPIRDGPAAPKGAAA